MPWIKKTKQKNPQKDKRRESSPHTTSLFIPETITLTRQICRELLHTLSSKSFLSKFFFFFSLSKANFVLLFCPPTPSTNKEEKNRGAEKVLPEAVQRVRSLCSAQAEQLRTCARWAGRGDAAAGRWGAVPRFLSLHFGVRASIKNTRHLNIPLPYAGSPPNAAQRKDAQNMGSHEPMAYPKHV